MGFGDEIGICSLAIELHSLPSEIKKENAYEISVIQAILQGKNEYEKMQVEKSKSGTGSKTTKTRKFVPMR